MKSRNVLWGGLVTALVLMAFLAVVGLVVGWNLFSTMGFWFVAMPIIANVASHFLSKGDTFLTATAGILFFYAIVVLLSYSHYQSDFYTVMKYSFGSGLFFLFVYHFDRLFPKKAI